VSARGQSGVPAARGAEERRFHRGHPPADRIPTTGEATWCFSLPAYKIAGRVAEIELYFDGPMTQENGPLIEIQLKIRGCVEDEAERWMRERFGPPIESKATREYWKNSFLWAGALLPSEPGRCLIHFLPLSENAEIERIKAE
jgi:hypothetical protein